MTGKGPTQRFPLLIGTGAFVMLWSIARASVQSITIDEADTYLAFVAPREPRQWIAHANNHVLNTMLMRLSTLIFGASPLTMRAPALLGTALYIAAAYLLVRRISSRRVLQWGLFACLTCSPLVMDYLVAARGYSMACAFLLWMVAIAADYQAGDAEARKERLVRTCALISASAALSVSANFSFAIADALTAVALAIWIARGNRGEYWRIAAAFVLPGLAVAYFLVWPVLFAWKTGLLTWGAGSLRQTEGSLIHAALYDPNGYLLHPQLRHYFVHFGTFLYPLLAVFAVCRLAMLLREKRWAATPIAVICASAGVAALAVHEILHAAVGIPLPLDRTALWVALLFLVMAGALAAPELSSNAGRYSGAALAGILAAIGCYNLSCLRLTYFNEWQYDAAMKDVYGVLASYGHTHADLKVSANWRYVASLNCYRTISPGESFDQIPNAPTEANQYPPGYQAYVVYLPVDRDFVSGAGLQTIYQDDFSGVAVAVKPDAAK